eukprot:TRINITY_DN2234_c0_g2_i1.p1 TRINITY_DN2234_c0_g2~~TRINITY_DN2234_c0_g2_i1.p1  ORF type:complete len:345 (+),score=43.67 TRINITY_DN2234_c0_g2_i1:65-1099(+)
MSHSEQSHFSPKNLLNFLQLILVPIPSIYLTQFLFSHCPFPSNSDPTSPPSPNSSTLLSLCSIILYHPILYVNLLYFFNCNVLFWILNLIQSSTWLIDPYWTIIPVMISQFYYQHPIADQNSNAPRALTCLVLIWIWSLRLQHSYFRRENFKFGEREDWRFTEMRKKNPKSFPVTSFFLAYVSQQPEVGGLTLPMWAVNLSPSARDRPFGVIDVILIVTALIGITVAYFADTQLRNFILQNEAIEKNGGKKNRLLDTGVWYYSRHPNYFGEQLFWWSMAGFGFLSGEWWTVAGTVINSIVLAVVTGMVEQRMLRDKSREELYKRYQRTTSVLIPFFKFSDKKTK